MQPVPNLKLHIFLNLTLGLEVMPSGATDIFASSEGETAAAGMVLMSNGTSAGCSVYWWRARSRLGNDKWLLSTM
jgi:hypothetical protein